MGELERIEDQLRRGLEGGAWHGPAVLELLAGVTAAQAHARPIPPFGTLPKARFRPGCWLSGARKALSCRLGAKRCLPPAWCRQNPRHWPRCEKLRNRRSPEIVGVIPYRPGRASRRLSPGVRGSSTRHPGGRKIPPRVSPVEA